MICDSYDYDTLNVVIDSSPVEPKRMHLRRQNATPHPRKVRDVYDSDCTVQYNAVYRRDNDNGAELGSGALGST